MNAAWLKLASLACIAVALVLLTLQGLRVQDSPSQRLYRKHVARLNALAARCFAPPTGERTAKLQALVTLLVLGASALLGLPLLLVAVVLLLVWAGPYVELEQRRRHRLSRIEDSVATFGLSLANSLRSSGNIGRALDRTRRVVPDALADELAVVQQELQLGSSIDEGLTNLGNRVKSVTLDLMLSGILISRQIGGDVATILETNAASIREMNRVQNVIRSKTAEGKGQLWVLGLAPPVIFVAFDTMQPGYFDPLANTAGGTVVLAVATLLWLASLASAKRILMVDV